MTNKRRTKTEEIDIRYDIDCTTLTKAAARLLELASEHGDCEIDVSAHDEYGSSVATVVIYKKRPETDKEMAARIADENKYKEIRRQQFETLKKEFGK